MIKNEEHNLQKSMIKWFDLQYPNLRMCLFAVPNGSNIGRKSGSYMKSEGLRSGVSDLVFVFRGNVTFIEIKTLGGKQQKTQKEFEFVVEENGFKYHIIRSFDDFRYLITNLIRDPYLTFSEYKKEIGVE